MPTRHTWSKTPNRETVHGSMQDVTHCTSCRMKRTRRPGTKTRELFRRAGETKWGAYRDGYIPDCVPVQEEA